MMFRAAFCSGASRISRAFFTASSWRRTFSSTRPTNKAVALIFDTETTSKVEFRKPASDPCQPDLVQLGMILVDTSDWSKKMQASMLVQPDQEITPEAQAVHGISKEDCCAYGVSRACAVQMFVNACEKADVIVAHNLAFDDKVMEAAMLRARVVGTQKREPRVCTMRSSTDILKLPGKRNNGSYKWPTLQEAYSHFALREGTTSIEEPAVIENAHDALADAEACLAVFRGLVDSEAISLDDFHSNKKAERDEIFTAAIDSSTSPTSVKIPMAGGAGSSLNPEEPLPLDGVAAQPGELGIKLQEGGFQVHGETYKHRETLKSFGAKWNPSNRVWEFYDCSMLVTVQQFAGLPTDDPIIVDPFEGFLSAESYSQEQ